METNRHLEKISDWTDENLMQLNIQKTKYMIFNFCKSKQFQTRLSIKNTILEQVHETKLLGVIISEDRTWHDNTRNIIRKAYMRMEILKKLYEFNVPTSQLVQIYKLFIRSVTEQSSVVWSSSITADESDDIERTQKVALRIILRDQYKSYNNALSLVNLQTLAHRRETLLLKFATKTLKNPKTAHMIKTNQPRRKLRNQEHFKVERARTQRFAQSTLNTIAHILNKS